MSIADVFGIIYDRILRFGQPPVHRSVAASVSTSVILLFSLSMADFLVPVLTVLFVLK